MYQNHTPAGKPQTQSPSFDTVPNADAGKSRIYTSNPGLPYSKGRAGSGAAGVSGHGGSRRGGYDPNYPMRR